MFLFQLLGAVGRSRRGATSSHQSVDREARSPIFPPLGDKEDDDKENKCSKVLSYRSKPVIESSDDDFDHCKSNSHHSQFRFQFQQYRLLQLQVFFLSVLVGKATPKNKGTPHKPLSAAKKDRSVCEDKQ